MIHDRRLLRTIICEALEDAGLARQTKAQRGPLIELALGFTNHWQGHLEIVGDAGIKEFLGNASLIWHKDVDELDPESREPLIMSGPILIGKNVPPFEIQYIKNALGIDPQEEVPISGAWRISLLPSDEQVRRGRTWIFYPRCDIALKNDVTGAVVQGSFTDAAGYARLPVDLDRWFSREMGSALIRLIIPTLRVIGH